MQSHSCISKKFIKGSTSGFPFHASKIITLLQVHYFEDNEMINCFQEAYW